MSAVFALPDLGEGLSEAEVVRWLVAAGDTVVVDEPVVEVETAKSLVELPSPFAGVVATLHGAEGEVVAVGAPLMTMADADAEAEAGGADQGAAAPAAGRAQPDGEPGPPQPRPTGDGAPLPGAVAEAVTEERAGSGNVLIGYGTSAPQASRGGRRGRRGRAASSPPPAGAGARAPLVASPLVRALAGRHGLDLAAVTGSGAQGLITRSDVEAAAGAIAPSAPPEPDASSVARTSSAGTDQRTGLPELRRVPVRGVRRATSEAVARSRREIPEATTWVDVDATALLELRASLAPTVRTAPGSATAGDAGAPPRGPGLLALVARFVVAGLARFPELNARLDTTTDEVVLLDGVNLGIATQTERGLVVPAVRDAHRLTARGLDAEIRRLTAAARSGASPAEPGGGSFTLNNYGVMGVDGSAAIINHPEVAILGVGRVLPRPWVVDGAVVARSITQLSLVFDHRVCDGGTAGGFLRFVADAVEDPGTALADL